MQSFQVLSAVAAPLLQENVDTDVIIRIERLTAAAPDLKRWGFEALRYLPDGTDNPAFVLNQAPYRGAQILLAGPNFGCGSSREGAVWVLMQLGLRSVIGSSFGEIFFTNCFQNGVLPVVLTKAAVEALAAEVRGDPQGRPLTVDLPNQRVVSAGGQTHSFAIPALLKQSLLEGLDELALTRKREPEIAAFQHADRSRRPWIYQTVERTA